MAYRGRRPVLPSPFLPELEAVPSTLRARGACIGSDPELFFDDERSAEASAVCGGCQILLECRTYALSNERFGVWGGLTASERRVLQRALVVTPEDREASASLRADLRTKTHAQIARERKCSVRSVERAATQVKLRDEAA